MGRATHPHAYYMIAGREKLSGRVRDPTDRVASRHHIGKSKFTDLPYVFRTNS